MTMVSLHTSRPYLQAFVIVSSASLFIAFDGIFIKNICKLKLISLRWLSFYIVLPTYMKRSMRSASVGGLTNQIYFWVKTY